MGARGLVARQDPADAHATVAVVIVERVTRMLEEASSDGDPKFAAKVEDIVRL
jgi:hypothetical protein